MNKEMYPLGTGASDRVEELPVSGTQTAGDLAQHLRNAYETRGEIDFCQFDGKLWALVLDGLIAHGMIDVASYAAPRLALAYPDVRFFKTMAFVLARLPPPSNDASFAAFRDDIKKEVQVVPRAGARTTLLGFCGRAGKMGIPLNLIHRWFGQLGVHVIYLRDFQWAVYDNGIESLASDLAGTLRALQQVIANLGTTRVVCYGNSFGGYGALRYALELRCEAVLSLAGPTNLFDPPPRIRNMVSGLNLRPLYQYASYAPRVHLVYAELNAFDRANALNLLGLPTVTLEMAPGGTRHNVFLRLLLQGRYERLIQWLVDPQRGMQSP